MAPGCWSRPRRRPEHAGWKFYGTDSHGTSVDVDAFLEARGQGVAHIERLLSATASRHARLSCFGLHEWAMVYRAGDELRHPLPLRLGQAGTDAVVEANPIACSHFDAFRFFTPQAAPLNAVQPTRATQIDLEQPGCLHANMDLYKWRSHETREYRRLRTHCRVGVRAITRPARRHLGVPGCSKRRGGQRISA